MGIRGRNSFGFRVEQHCEDLPQPFFAFFLAEVFVGAQDLAHLIADAHGRMQRR
jgi:hypothetical protein